MKYQDLASASKAAHALALPHSPAILTVLSSSSQLCPPQDLALAAHPLAYSSSRSAHGCLLLVTRSWFKLYHFREAFPVHPT